MPRVTEDEMRAFAFRVLSVGGQAEGDALAVVEGLIAATKRGVTTHGVFRLPQYFDCLTTGRINTRPKVAVIMRRGVVALVDADGGYGFRPSVLAMDEAVAMARENGVGLVSVRNSHHFGMAAAYAERAAHRGLIGIATTNTFPNMAPAGGIGTVLGNNPISIAVPRRAPHAPVVLDMALSQVAKGRVRVAAANGERIPQGWGYDAKGRATTDPQDILRNGILAAIGEHKGAGLSMMVEMLAGILSGSPFGATSDNHDKPTGGVGHFHLAIAPDFLRDMTDFHDDVEELIRQVKGVPRAEGVDEIHLPGEIEAARMTRADEEGLTVSRELVGQLDELAQRAGVTAPAWIN